MNVEAPRASSTTCKVVFGLSYVHRHMSTSFIVRLGDDAYFKIDLFLLHVAPYYLQHPELGDFVMGSWSVPTSSNPGNNIKSNLKEPYGLQGFPRYPLGMGFVFGGQVAAAIVAMHEQVGLVDGYPEDAVVGMWLLPMSDRVGRIYSPCFYDIQNADGSQNALLVHYMTPFAWNMLFATGKFPTGMGMLGPRLAWVVRWLFGCQWSELRRMARESTRVRDADDSEVEDQESEEPRGGSCCTGEPESATGTRAKHM